MFKKLIMLLTFGWSIGTLSAQKGFRIGPYANYITSRPYVVDSLPDNFNFRFKSGFNAGAAFQYGFTDKFTLGLGLGYSSKGYRLFNDSNNNGNLLRHNFSNLELPINAIYKMRIGSSSRMRVVAGFTLNYQIGTKEKVLKNDNGTFVISEKSITPIYPMGNLGIEIASEGKTGNIFVFGVYYKQSFVNQTELSIFNSSDLTKERNFALGFRGSYIGIGFSYLFDLKNFSRSEQFFY